MTERPGRDRSHETAITVRYWAGARSAAGVAEDVLDVLDVTVDLTLADVVARVLELHPGDRMARTVAVCSVLLGDQPVGSRDPGAVVVPVGSVVELLPPFAGG